VNQGALPVQAQAPVQGGNLTGPLTQLMISLDLMTSFGSSTARDDAISELQGGAHDPRKRGFTLQQAEIQMNGAVDPYFRGQFVLVSSLEPDEGETIVEVEEAWLVTQQLPYNLQVKGGHYLTDFGRLNQIHPHAWDFQDQPVMMTRVFGADGLRAPGARLSYLAPMPTYLEFLFGVQNGNGETLQSFNANDEVYEERPVGGRFLDEDARVVRSFGDMLWHGRIATATDFDRRTRSAAACRRCSVRMRPAAARACGAPTSCIAGARSTTAAATRSSRCRASCSCASSKRTNNSTKRIR